METVIIDLRPKVKNFESFGREKHADVHFRIHVKAYEEYLARPEDPANSREAVQAFEYLSRMEGIIPAIESAHAVAYAMDYAKQLDPSKNIVVTISGRGDKDCVSVARYRGQEISE